jgi:DNA polymerase III epsilon subunit-like protein
MRFDNKYIAIDIETTDADSSKGDIIQIGAVVLNEDLSIGKEFSTYIAPLTAHRNPKATEVHKISEEVLAVAPECNDALAMFEEFALEVDRRPILAAWASYFDVPFLEAQYAKIGRKYPFSYKNIDLKTIALWEAARRDMDMSGLKLGGGVTGFLTALGLEFEGSAHDGLDDIRNSIRIIQEFAKR